jgi:hypothetical protein
MERDRIVTEVGEVSKVPVPRAEGASQSLTLKVVKPT